MDIKTNIAEIGKGVSRRKVLLGGLAAIIAGREAPGVIIRSNLAGEKTKEEAEGEGGWVNPYVTEGLIAMWDGEWNAGGGVHDPNATVWKDLSGDTDLSLIAGRGSFTEDAFVMGGGGYAATAAFADSGLVRSIEICYADIKSEGRWIEVQSPNIGYYSQFNQNQLYVSATTQPKIATVYTSSPSTMSVIYDEDFAATVYRGAAIVAQSNGTTTSVASASNRVTLGGRYVNNTPSVALTGKYFSVRLYSRALSAAEIAYNYGIDKERFNLP